MPWYIQLCLGFLLGYSIIDPKMRHHLLTLIIWSCKALRFISVWLFIIGLRLYEWSILGCEWLQDHLDEIEIDYSEPIKKEFKARDIEPVKVKISSPIKEKDGLPNFDTMDVDAWHKWIAAHPDQVSSKK